MSIIVNVNEKVYPAIRTFCLGKHNWMFNNIANGANASALVYSIPETAKINNLRP